MTTTRRQRPYSRRVRTRSATRAAARAARTGWDRAIDAWDHFEEQGLDYSREFVHGPELLRAIGPVRGLRVLDLGCGQGRFTRRLAGEGARITAVDWSCAMIAAARRHERAAPLGIEYHRLDAGSVGRRWGPATFDRVVACMSLQDMPDVPRVLRAAHRLLRDDGRLVFSVSHPFNTAAKGWERPAAAERGALLLDEYFEEGPGITEWRMARLRRPFDTIFWHRTLETWFRELSRAGFVLDWVTEPRATARQAKARAALRGTRKVPFFLVVGCRKRYGPGLP